MPKVPKIPFMKLRQAPPLDWRGLYPKFNRLALETCSSCNRRCWFCPISSGRRDFSMKLMSDGLFERICRQLRELRWEGFIEMFLLNEPMLDPKLLERASKLRSITPKSTIYLSTNGDKFTKAKNPLTLLQEVYDAGFNSVNFNIYGKGSGDSRMAFYRELIDNAVALGLCQEHTNKYRRVPASKKFVAVTNMSDGIVKRANCDAVYDKVAEVRVRLAPERAYCSRPHRHFVINYDGRIPLCCAMDSTHPDAVFVGDANKQHLLEIWNNEPLMKHRYFLQDGNRRALRQCRNCHYRMAFPHCVRLIKADKSVVQNWQQEEVTNAKITK